MRATAANSRSPHAARPVRAGCVSGPRPTDRYQDNRSVGRFASQTENQSNLTVTTATTEPPDGRSSLTPILPAGYVRW